MPGLLAAIALAIAVSCSAQPTAGRFDPARDPARDVAAAVAQAKAQGKRVIVDVGGEWCTWCHILDRFLASDAEAGALAAEHYVWVKVNWSQENRNEAFRSRYPAIGGYPHLFVLDDAGRLRHSQDTGLLEAGRDYDRAKVVAFLRKWAPPARA